MKRFLNSPDRSLFVKRGFALIENSAVAVRGPAFL